MSRPAVVGPVPSDSARGLALPGDVRTAGMIARRAAAEALRDRLTLGVSAVWSLLVPLLVALLVVRPAARAESGAPLGTVVAIYLLVVGLLPSSAAIGIASGLFAGENEQGTLLPLLATPASNRAIFGGKVLGAVLPALLYAAIADVTYLAEIRALLGAGALGRVPPALAVTMVALVPVVTVLGAAVASLVSSRVRTYQSAQMLSSLILYPIMGAFFALAVQMPRWGTLGLALAVGAIAALDALLIGISAATWRREEVLARR